MADVIREEPLPGGGVRVYYSDGRIINRGIDGKILPGGTMTPDVARETAAGWKVKKSAERASDVDDLLDELGLESKSARLLAETFVSGGSGAVAAARELFKMSPRSVVVSPGFGERCPVCGIVKGADRALELLNPEMARLIVNLLEPIARAREA
jgi:hypothetical protein